MRRDRVMLNGMRWRLSDGQTCPVTTELQCALALVGVAFVSVTLTKTPVAVSSLGTECGRGGVRCGGVGWDGSGWGRGEARCNVVWGWGGQGRGGVGWGRVGWGGLGVWCGVVW